MSIISEFNKFAINPHRERYTENDGYRPPTKKGLYNYQRRKGLESKQDERAIERAHSLEGLFDDD
ncbi:hypothetical protein HG263_06750 [Pseudoalteromonas sp. JBTF-M23]|uniref:Uncharacterized protein n=1 Tax=Pseudoalteromonas caenipelagi TaxID=2726988 RepID=A0A849VEV9_9GAMM|nr:hypothetical protein [Pseudoalteromonas caenipelagi]NOU50241.1 hypothetical protein [Pseudoalteromonas caenipelagi]